MGGLAEGGEDTVADLLDRPDAGNLVVAGRVRIPGRGPLRVVRDERLGLLVVDAEAFPDRLLLVVVALDEVLARGVVLARHLRRVVLDVVGAPRGQVDAAAGHAVDDHGVVDVDLDHVLDAHARGLHRLGLRDRARKAVEEKPAGAIGGEDALLHQPGDDVVGDEVAAVHHRLGREPERRAGLDGAAQHVARRDLRNAVLLRDEARLRALAGTRTTQQDQAHAVAPRETHFFES
jgi:hypothetical protein